VTILAVVSQKGGAGKTTAAVNFGHWLATQGHKTLIVDLDPQGNSTDAFGVKPGNDLVMLLTPGIQRPLAECICPTGREKLDIVRSDNATAALQITLAGVNFRERVLLRALNKADYDYILLDCAPSASLLQIAAIVAADWMLIPTELEQWSIKGVQTVLMTLKTTLDEGGTRCRPIGILPNMYDRRKADPREQLTMLAKSPLSGLLLPPIPTDARVPESARARQTLLEYDAHCRALTGFEDESREPGGYLQVFDRLTSRMNARRN